ncbi:MULTISPECIES: translation initiation factor 2 [Paenibacillus]|uniref:translation initiation factor 2 n=1 Tax=Paenibacillus TaxID=44249 RepID=UPI00227DC70B|nr:MULTISPECIES: translation initiation factor 2 [Paenibacillus]MCY7487545.1 translation initiation factor 2 [Paenibacillus alvei]
MTRFMKQLIGVVVLLTLGVFIGMEITSSGIERIYGPINASRATSALDSTDRYAAPGSYRDNLPIDNRRHSNGETALQDNPRTAMNETETRVEDKRQNQLEAERSETNRHVNEMNNSDSWPVPPVKDATVNQLADKTAGVLQRVSQAGIRAVVGLFNGLF